MAFVCNPYLAVLQKRMYERFWKEEVDEVLINVNGCNDVIRQWIIDLWKDDKVKYIDDVPSEIRQGPAFDNLYKHVSDDIGIVITMDSDNFIFKNGVLDYFKDMLDGEYGSIGSLGYHAYPGSVSDLALEKYGTARLNPFMSFWKKEIIDQIKDVDFCTYNYKKGEKFGPLGVLPDDGWMDIMCKFSLNYFKISPKFLKITQTQEGKYIHIAALSSIMRRHYRDLENKNTQLFVQSTGSKQKLYYMAWNYAIYHFTKDVIPFKEYNIEYEKGMWSEANKAELKKEDIIKLGEEFITEYKVFTNI